MTNYTIRALNFPRKTGEPEKEKCIFCDLNMLPFPARNSGLFLTSAVQAISMSNNSVLSKSNKNLA